MAAVAALSKSAEKSEPAAELVKAPAAVTAEPVRALATEPVEAAAAEEAEPATAPAATATTAEPTEAEATAAEPTEAPTAATKAPLPRPAKKAPAAGNYGQHSKVELQAELVRRGLPKSGNVAELRERLVAADKK